MAIVRSCAVTHDEIQGKLIHTQGNAQAMLKLKRNEHFLKR